MSIIGISGRKGSGKDTIGKIIQILTNFPKADDTTVLKYLNENTSNNVFEIKKFAGVLKQITSILTGVKVEDLENEDVKNTKLSTVYIVEDTETIRFSKLEDAIEEYERRKHQLLLNFSVEEVSTMIFLREEYITPRVVLQVLGTEIGRQINPDIWVNFLMKDYKPSELLMSKIRRVSIRIRLEESLPNWIITDVRFLNEAEAIKERGGKLIRVNRPGQASRSKDNHESEIALDNYKSFDHIIKNIGGKVTLIQQVRKLLKTENLI